MDDNELRDWLTCFQVNLHFHEASINSNNATCIICSEACGAVKRSNFWLQATHCSAGHRQATPAEIRESPTLSVCNTCDQNYILNVLKRKYFCRREGCRRIVRVNEAAVRENLIYDKQLLQDFLALVERSRIYECAIHLDDMPFEAPFFESVKPPTPQCDHDRSVCDECLEATFEAAINGRTLENLSCPDPKCRAKLPRDRVKKYVSKQAFKSYNDQLAVDAAATKFPNFRWCDCGHGQIHEPGESNPEWKCLRCKKRNCYICVNDSSRSCDHLAAIDAANEAKRREQRFAAYRALQMAEREDERARAAQATAARAREAKRKEAQKIEAASAATTAEVSKLCPRAGCGLRIKRTGGCAHFTCTKCRTHFCWCCKAIWPGGTLTRIHVTGCRFACNSGISKRKLDLSLYTRDWDKDLGYDVNLDSDLYL